MDLEREMGITIKANRCTLQYDYAGSKPGAPTAKPADQYTLNLIDTPGHVDFHYEVQKALQACEGAILVVDATQGVQAQTVANAYAAVEVGLEIIPVAHVDEVLAQALTQPLAAIEWTEADELASQSAAPPLPTPAPSPTAH